MSESKALEKLKSASSKLQAMIKQNDNAINELRPIANQLGYDINPNQNKNLVTGIRVYQNDIVYEVSFIGNVCCLLDFELSKEKDVLIACGINEKQPK